MGYDDVSWMCMEEKNILYWTLGVPLKRVFNTPEKYTDDYDNLMADFEKWEAGVLVGGFVGGAIAVVGYLAITAR